MYTVTTTTTTTTQVKGVKLKLSGLVKGDVELTKRKNVHTTTTTSKTATTRPSTTTTKAKGIKVKLSGNAELDKTRLSGFRFSKGLISHISGTAPNVNILGY